MNLLATVLRVENQVDTWLASIEDLSRNGSVSESEPCRFAKQQWNRASNESFSPSDVKEVASTSNSFTVEMTAMGSSTSYIKIEWNGSGYTVTYKPFGKDVDTKVQCIKGKLYETLCNAIIQCWP